MNKDHSTVRGDAGDLPDRGTSRGMPTADPHTAGAEKHPTSTNRIGGFTAKSDPAETRMPKKPAKGMC